MRLGGILILLVEYNEHAVSDGHGGSQFLELGSSSTRFRARRVLVENDCLLYRLKSG